MTLKRQAAGDGARSGGGTGNGGNGRLGQLKGKTRIEKSEQIRDALLRAAADVVGEVGYANASITLITQRAGVAQGTFYNYFESRQAILDEIMPAVGRSMLAFVREAALASKGRTYPELEENSFRGFFSFLEGAPHFFRVLHEADIFAPAGFREHIDNVFKHYVQFLERSHAKGEMPGYDKREFEVVALVLMAARDYLAIHYIYGEDGQQRLPEWVTQAYMKFVRYGLEGVPQAPASGRTAEKKKKTD